MIADDTTVIVQAEPQQDKNLKILVESALRTATEICNRLKFQIK